MKTVVVTGAGGFIGRNLCADLRQRGQFDIREFDLGDTWEVLKGQIQDANFVVHLAGVNRPSDPAEYDAGNRVFTERILDLLSGLRRPIMLVFASSIQAALDNPYGKSKKAAEDIIREWATQTGNPACVYRLPNVFGKWCRPNYNSVVATFCHSIARGLPIEVRDPAARVTLAYIDDVIEEFTSAIQGHPTLGKDGFCSVSRTFTLTLQQLAEMLRSFAESRMSLMLPAFDTDLARFLYATFISYLPDQGLGTPLEMKRDERGWLAEFVKSASSGQVFISRTRPGVTRGNHWHHTKAEKFLVIDGEAVIRLRKLGSTEVIEIPVSGAELRVVDIPPGHTHSIMNAGTTELITLFWADEVFNPGKPDTYREGV